MEIQKIAALQRVLWILPQQVSGAQHGSQQHSHGSQQHSHGILQQGLV